MATNPFHAARDTLFRNRDDLTAARAAFRWPVLDRFNWALDHFDRLPGDQTALWIVGEGEERLTFAQMRVRSNQVANWLRARGVRRGDRVLLLLGNVRPLWEATLACMKLGAVVIPAATMLTAEDLRDRIERGYARHAIADGAVAPRFEGLEAEWTRIAVGGAPGWERFEDAYEASEDFKPDGETLASDPLLLYFTSGTTSKPKLVLHSHQSYPVGHLSTMYWLGCRAGDVHLNISSPGWAKHAWSSLFAPWNAGATVVALNQPRFDARLLLSMLERCRVTTFCAPPTVWRMLVQEDLTTAKVGLREVLAAGEPLNPEVIEVVRRAWGLTIRDGYGQTETTLQIGNSPGMALTPGSMGRPMPGYEVALLDPDGVTADEGEIALRLGDDRPLGLMQGYAGDDGEVRPVEGAWYRTGDVASRNPDGSLTYVGRSDDVFKSSGYRISPFELESALIEHPAVAEAAVVPSPDPARTALPKAFVVLAEGWTPDATTARAIFMHLKGRLAPYKRVRRIEFASLPKTISGKIRRVELRRVEAARRAQGARGDAEFAEEDLEQLPR